MLRTRFRRRILIRTIAALVLGYVAVCIIMMCLETSLVYPAPRFPSGNGTPKSSAIEDVYFKADDGVELNGLYCENPSARGTLLYFHGNGGDVSELGDFIQRVSRLYDLNVFAFDYRGYGKSQGQPDEAGLQRDSRAALLWLCERTKLSAKEIIFHGRSIGGGVAVELAAASGCKALILENTFAKLPDAAAQQYPWLPVRMLMRNQYPSVERICKCSQPLLQCHGTADQIVPFWSGRKLFDACPSENKQFIVIPGGSHNQTSPQEFWTAFGMLVSKLAPNPTERN